MFLDPFDGRLQILRDIKTHCVANDEAMMEHAMVQATKAILITDDSSSSGYRSSAGYGSHDNSNNNNNKDDDDDNDAEIAGAAIDESIYQNHTQSTRLHHADTQELLSDNEYFTFDVTPYFVDDDDDDSHNSNSMAGRRRRFDGRDGGLRAAFEEDQFDLCYVGVDARPIMEFDEYSSHDQNHKTHSTTTTFLLCLQGLQVLWLPSEELSRTSIMMILYVRNSQYGNGRISPCWTTRTPRNRTTVKADVVTTKITIITMCRTTKGSLFAVSDRIWNWSISIQEQIVHSF